mgnify:CR=1 FL=1
MLKADFKPYTLIFNEPGGTSRGVLTQKPSWIVRVWDTDNSDVKGVGEVSVIPKLSPESQITDIDAVIAAKIAGLSAVDVADDEQWHGIPAVRFGFETALRDLQTGGRRLLYESAFTSGLDGICINGLVWMGDIATMRQRVQQKYNAGFRCIKLKIGALDFDRELQLVEYVRNEFPEVEIRLDANGAFAPEDALFKLEKLALLDIHSIEQPIRAGNWQAMTELCRRSPIKIALDEELIGIESNAEEMLKIIKPQYVILKPSLIGGVRKAEQWIDCCKRNDIGWWVTSALECNIGLNAIAQWVYTQNVTMPQGLGTGMVYSNNFGSPLIVDEAKLWHRSGKWDFSNLYQ